MQAQARRVKNCPTPKPNADAKADLGGHENHSHRPQIDRPNRELVKDNHIRTPFIRVIRLTPF